MTGGEVAYQPEQKGNEEGKSREGSASEHGLLGIAPQASSLFLVSSRDPYWTFKSGPRAAPPYPVIAPNFKRPLIAAFAANNVPIS